jgi:hypothetical protein
VAGLEFGEEAAGQIVIIRKALYGLALSSEQWHSHFANTLRSLGFTLTQYDSNFVDKTEQRQEGLQVHMHSCRQFFDSCKTARSNHAEATRCIRNR